MTKVQIELSDATARAAREAGLLFWTPARHVSGELIWLVCVDGPKRLRAASEKWHYRPCGRRYV